MGIFMKSLFATAAVLSLAVSSASAADLAARPYTKAPAYSAPIYNWTGLYIGAEAGYGWSKNPLAEVNSPLSLGTLKPNGALVGGVVGFNWQFAPNLVIGAEGSFNWADLSDRKIDPFNTDLTFATKIDGLSSVTGRLGYAWGPWLVYGKGGGAWVHDRLSVIGSLFDDVTFNRFGWTAGGGVEWLFASNWSAKIEYAHYDFGQKFAIFGDEAATTKLTLDSVKAGINYHWN